MLVRAFFGHEKWPFSASVSFRRITRLRWQTFRSTDLLITTALTHSDCNQQRQLHITVGHGIVIFICDHGDLDCRGTTFVYFHFCSSGWVCHWWTFTHQARFPLSLHLSQSGKCIPARDATITQTYTRSRWVSRSDFVWFTLMIKVMRWFIACLISHFSHSNILNIISTLITKNITITVSCVTDQCILRWGMKFSHSNITHLSVFNLYSRIANCHCEYTVLSLVMSINGPAKGHFAPINDISSTHLRGKSGCYFALLTITTVVHISVFLVNSGDVFDFHCWASLADTGKFFLSPHHCLLTTVYRQPTFPKKGMNLFDCTLGRYKYGH